MYMIARQANKGAFACVAVLALACLAGCSDDSGKVPGVLTQIANPASEYCVKKGGTLEIVKDEDGNERGMCHLPDGTVVDEWKLFRRDHAQDQQGSPDKTS